MSEELRDRLSAVLEELAEGFGATLPEVRRRRELVTLECAVAEATGNGRTTASLDEVGGVVRRFLEEAADSLAQDPTATTVPNRAKAARAALSLKPELGSRPYTAVKERPGRQQAIGEWLGIAKESVDNKRQDGTSPRSELIEDIAEHLALRELDFLVEARRLAQRARRPPLESAMRVEWLGRFERYYTIWNALSGLRHDLEMAIDHLRHDEVPEAELFIRKSLYYDARFLTAVKLFKAQNGGLWILPDTRTEDAIADAIWFVRKPMPCSEVTDSLLRITFAQAPELAPFLHETFANRQLQPIVTEWREWIARCRCARPNRPRRDCDIHATIEWARFYMEAVDAQWDFLSDWYDLPRPGTTVDPVRQARRGRPVFPPPMPVDKRRQTG
jgi:hypothetical protein